MKRKHLHRQSGIADFKNKCSEMVKLYDARIVREIFELVQEKIYWNGVLSQQAKKDVSNELEVIFKKQRVSVMHLEAIISEVLTYFGNFLILLDSTQRRQN